MPAISARHPKNGIVLEDSFTGLLNLNAYMDKIYLLTSDNYSSMGVLTVSIANIAASSEHRDARQRAQMLLQLTEVLKALFGRALLFPHGQRRSRSALPQHYPRRLSGPCLQGAVHAPATLSKTDPLWLCLGGRGSFLARSWSKEARAIMLCDQLEVAGSSPIPHEPVRRGTDVKTQEGLERFVVFFQPKVDMRSGKTVGAEALVRESTDVASSCHPRILWNTWRTQVQSATWTSSSWTQPLRLWKDGGAKACSFCPFP